MLRQALITAAASFLFAAVVHPAMTRYKAWKTSPREIVARRNWRGEYVPDLGLIRFERALWALMIIPFVLGLILIVGLGLGL